MVKIFGEPVPVKADIYTIGGLSAHGDQAAILDWLGHFRRPPEHTFVVPGEAEAATVLRETIEQRLGWNGVSQPKPHEEVLL